MLLATAIVLHAQTSVPQDRALQIPRISSPPRIEEFLNGRSRADMRRIDDFRQREPGDGVSVSRKTVVWIGYDNKNFYSVFVCDAPPDATRAHLGKREDIFNDDFVGVFLDTYKDRQHAYEFFVNPLGVQADGIATDGHNDDYNFDTLWQSDGRLTPDGFVVTIAVPFRSLRFSSADVQSWGLGFARFIPTNNEGAFWPFVSYNVAGTVSQLGTVNGLEQISPGRNIQLIPYFSAGQEHFLNDPANGTPPGFVTNEDHRAGLETKAIIHYSLTLDVTLNPDFSQVESDDPQVTVNQRYAVQFPEKRPFFLENNTYFVTPENLFFSRNIVDPEFGGRLTGRLGRWNLGVLGVDDRAPGITAAPGDPGYGTHALIGVLRAQRQFARRSNFGFLVTNRQFGGGYNRVGSADLRLQISPIWVLTGQAMASQTTTPSTGSSQMKSGGDAFNFSLLGTSRTFYSNLQYIDRSEGFVTQLGFVPRVNIRQVQEFVQKKWYPKSSWLVWWGPSLTLMGDADHRGVQQDWLVQPQINFEMKRTTLVGFTHGEIFERFNNINFRRTDTSVGWHTEYFRKAILDGGYDWGTRINYSTPAGLNAFLGKGGELQSTLTFRPTPRLKIDEIYFYTHLRTLPNSFATVQAPAAVFANHLIRSRANYQFSKELSLRVIVDYNATLQNPSLITLDRQKKVTGDVLLTYLLNPGTALYVGYTDSLENLALVNGQSPSVMRLPFPSVTTQRQFFVKLSYLLRF